MSRKSKQKKQDEIDLTEPTVGTDVDAVDATTELGSVESEELGTDLSKSAPEDRETEGPLDEAEANSVRPYIDLGGVKILPREGLNLRLEIEESTKRIVAVGLDYAGSTLQVQPFAAPRSTGLWNETRVQIQEQIAKQGGTATERDGVFGPELVAEVPVMQGTDGAAGMRIARFVGVDGPRWFLRGVIAGEGATNPEAAAKVEDLFRSIVVVRGSAPMPPRDLIPLKMPASATPTA